MARFAAFFAAAGAARFAEVAFFVAPRFVVAFFAAAGAARFAGAFFAAAGAGVAFFAEAGAAFFPAGCFRAPFPFAPSSPRGVTPDATLFAVATALFATSDTACVALVTASLAPDTTLVTLATASFAPETTFVTLVTASLAPETTFDMLATAFCAPDAARFAASLTPSTALFARAAALPAAPSLCARTLAMY